MMDSQENIPAQGIEEEQQAAPATPVTDNSAEETQNEPAKKVYASKKEVLDRVKEIAESDETPDKDEVDHLKAAFYRFHIAERDQKQKEYLEAGGDPEKYQIMPDDDEETFKANMQLIKEKRAKAFEKAQQEREENLKHREEIIEKIKNMATSPDEANKSYKNSKTHTRQRKKT